MKCFAKIVFGLLLLLPLAGICQRLLQVLPAQKAEASLLGSYSYQQQQPDSLAALQEAQNLLQQLHNRGYLLARLLHLEQQGDTTRVYVLVGEQYQWVTLRPGNVEERALLRAGYRERFYRQKPFSYAQVARLMRRLVAQAEQSGYPFAQLRLDSLEINTNSISAALRYEPGPYITFDSLQLSGDAKIKHLYLASHLGIHPNQPFNQQLVEEVVQKIRALPFVRLAAPPRLSFQNSQARLWLQLKQKPANRLDGILGLQSKPLGGVLVTGQLDLLLQNPFGGGKTLGVNWQRLNEESQQLELLYRHPYLLRTPLSLLLEGGLLKEQEQFLNRNLQLALQSRQAAGIVLSLEYLFKDTRLLDQASGPNLASVSLHKYGVRAVLDRLDDPLFPRQGFLLGAGFLIGPKNVTRLADGSTERLGKSTQLTVDLTAQRYWALSARTVLAVQAEGALLQDEQLFLPDLYRLGGLLSLRGFREKSLFASRYGIVQTELRQQFGNSSYIFLFYDQAWLAYKFPAVQYADWPAGIGAGLRLQTEAGLFSLIYALGNQQNQSFSIRNSQVHFGYTNRF